MKKKFWEIFGLKIKNYIYLYISNNISIFVRCSHKALFFNMKRLSIVDLRLSYDRYIYTKLYSIFSLCKEEKSKNGITWSKGGRIYFVYDKGDNALHFSTNLIHVLKTEFNVTESNVYTYVKIFMEFNTKLKFDSVRCA